MSTHTSLYHKSLITASVLGTLTAVLFAAIKLLMGGEG